MIGSKARIGAQSDATITRAAELERRYQAPVDLGVVSRGVARDILAQGNDQWIGGIPEIPEGFRVE